MRSITSYKRKPGWRGRVIGIAATALALLLSARVLCASGTNAPVPSVEVTVVAHSPRHTFYVEHHTLATNEVMQEWLVSFKDPGNRQLLYTHDRSAQVLIADNENSLVVNDYSGSNSSEVILFRRRNELDYQKVEDITNKAWAFFAAQSNLKSPPMLDHRYVEAVRWTDNQTILLRLHGHYDRDNRVDDWLCLYDVVTKTFSTDLNQHNRRHTKIARQ